MLDTFSLSPWADGMLADLLKTGNLTIQTILTTLTILTIRIVRIVKIVRIVRPRSPVYR